MGLDSVELIMALEEKLSIELEEADVAQVRTVEDLVKVSSARLECASRSMPREELYAVVVNVLWEQLRIPAHKIGYRSRLAEDLGID